MDTDGGKFRRIQNAIGAGGDRGHVHEFAFGFEERKRFAGAFERLTDRSAADHFDNFVRGDRTGIGDMVDAEGDLFFETFPTGADKFVEVRNGIAGFEEAFVAHQLG